MNFHKRKKSFYKLIGKRILDILISFLLFIILLPFLSIVSIIIVLTSGRPIFFVQDRIGLNSKPFRMIKFRSMSNQTENDNVVISVNKRVTKVGKFLRKFSIDELPELINVIRGEMSLVGPRPLLTEYLTYFDKDEMRRHIIRPGITGYAQTRGRNLLSWRDRFKLDLFYVDNLTFLFDLKILFLTVANVLLSRSTVNVADVKSDAYGDYFEHNGKKFRPLSDERKYEKAMKAKKEMCNRLEYREIDVDQVDRYRKKLKDMLKNDVYSHHYPEQSINTQYIEKRYLDLREYLEGNCTRLIGAFDGEQLVGFIWLYKRPFMDYFRLVVNSIYIVESCRGLGVGNNLMSIAENLASEMNCREMATHFAVINDAARSFYLSQKFTEKRIEVVKTVGKSVCAK